MPTVVQCTVCKKCQIKIKKMKKNEKIEIKFMDKMGVCHFCGKEMIDSSDVAGFYFVEVE